MKLNQLAPKTRKTRKRKGQGNAAGQGTYAGRGCKGQNSRAGGGVRLGFEGGQTPLIQRMPKLRGFRNPNRVETQVINLSDLEAKFKDGDTVNLETLIKAKLINKNNSKVKILGNGTCKKKLNITDSILLSKTAEKALAKPAKKGE